MAKLTLSVNPSVVSKAKLYAKKQGLSISEMVEAYLASLSKPPAIPEMPPVLRSLRGTLKKANLADHRKHLSEKYR